MHKEALKIRQGCIQFDVVDKPRAHRCQTQTYPVQTILHSVRYLSHSEAEAYKPYVNPEISHKSLGEFCVIGVHPICFFGQNARSKIPGQLAPRCSEITKIGSNVF